MRYFFTLIAVLCVVVCATLTNAGPVQDSTAFQGSLTDASNNPVPDGPKDLILSVWTDSVGGTMLHSEVVVVTTSKGLFSTCLGCGSSTFLDNFDGQTLFLQTQLTGQAPMVPRTRLRNTPQAMMAARVRGDISTNPGFVIVGDSAAGGSVRVNAGLQNAGGVVAQGANLRITGDPDFDLLRLSAGPDSAKIRISGQSTGDPDFDLLRIQGGVGSTSQGASMAITGDPDFDLLRLSADPDSAKIRISGQSTGDPDFDLLRIQGGVGATSQGASVAITGDPDFDLLRLSADADSAKISISAQSAGDPDFDLLRITGGSGEAHVSLHSAPSSAVGVANTWKDDDCDGISARSVLGGMSGSTTGTIRMVATPDSAGSVSVLDSDGDGIPESSCREAAHPKLAEAVVRHRTGSTTGTIRMAAIPDTASSVVECDSDGDGIPESYSREAAHPKLAEAVVKHRSGSTTGTIRMAAEPSTTSSTADIDDDGDGNSESAVRTILSGTFKGGPGNVILQLADVDDDGVPENEIESSITPTTSAVAIKTKGTGADPNRVVSQTNSAGASTDVAAGAKNIGLHVREVTGQCDLTMTDATSGTTDTTIIIDGTAKRFGIGVAQPAYPMHHSSGAHLTTGGVWTNASDANLKENFQPVDGNKILEKIEELPISQWNYKSESEEVTHIGPTAQDFQKVFGVGENDKTISTIDPSGIALAAIKELNKRNEKLDKENQKLRRELDELKKLVQQIAAGK